MWMKHRPRPLGQFPLSHLPSLCQEGRPPCLRRSARDPRSCTVTIPWILACARRTCAGRNPPGCPRRSRIAAARDTLDRIRGVGVGVGDQVDALHIPGADLQSDIRVGDDAQADRTYRAGGNDLDQVDHPGPAGLVVVGLEIPGDVGVAALPNLDRASERVNPVVRARLVVSRPRTPQLDDVCAQRDFGKDDH